MRYSSPQIVFQEVPDEISLALSISGCDVGCHGCHSAHTWDPTHGEVLDEVELMRLLRKYDSLISCVLFYGGEWEPSTLTSLASATRSKGLRTCLYTGRELNQIPKAVISVFDFIKTGPWKHELGGLTSPTSNQKFLSVENFGGVFRFEDQTFKFQGERG